jgi:hypothetical protein
MRRYMMLTAKMPFPTLEQIFKVLLEVQSAFVPGNPPNAATP